MADGWMATLLAATPFTGGVLPPPATVVITPLASTLRTTAFPPSTMYQFPAPSAARQLPRSESSRARANFAAVAGPPSPVYPLTPVPATVLLAPAGGTC